MPSSPTDEDIIAGVVIKRLKSKFYFIYTHRILFMKREASVILNF